MRLRGEHVLTGFVSICLLAISVVLMALLPQWLGKELSAINLTVTLVVAISVLISILVLASWILTCWNLSNPNEALALPTGSVRALIALTLILIFAIMSIFMFQLLTEPSTTTIIERRIFSNVTGGNQTFTNTTQTISGTSADMIDFSKQMLTTISTLVVAIAAFYFGTRSVQVAKGAKEKAELYINPSGKTKLLKDQTLTIVVKPTPENALYTWEIEGDERSSVVEDSQDRTRLFYTPTKEEADVTITFKMPEYKDVDPQKLAITVEKPALSIKPSGKTKVKKTASLTVVVKTTPENATVNCKIDGDDDDTVVQDKKKRTKWTYTPKIEAGKTATLTFTMPKYEDVKPQKLTVTVEA